MARKEFWESSTVMFLIRYLLARELDNVRVGKLKA